MIKKMKKEKWFFVGILLYLLVNISGLFIPIVVNAAKYAQIGREILDHQNWINLTIGGDAYDQKPPLLFWIAALVFQLSGISVVTYKATILLISLIGIYSTFKLGELLYDRRTGILAAFFWATCLGYVHYHNDIHTDTLLVVPVISAIWQYAAFFKYHKNYQFYLGTVFTGLGMLTKGPVAMVIIGSAVGLHLLLTRNFKAIFNYRWLIAFPIVMLLILPALWGLYTQFGLDGIKFYFWTNNFGRINGTYAGHNTDPFFYIHTTLYMIAPWAAFSFTAIFMQIREKVQRNWKFTDTDEFYILGGILTYLIINSVARAKNPHYELVILPLISILAARWAFLIFEKRDYIKLRKALGSVHLGTGIILFILSGIFLIYVFPESRVWIWVIIVLMAVAFIYVLTWEKSLNKQLTYLVLAISALLFTLNTNVLPNLSKYQSSFEACRVFNEKAGPNEKLHIYTEEGRYWEIFLYSKNYGKYIITPEGFKRVNPPVNDWLYTGPEGVKQLAQMKIPADTIRILQHNSMTRLPFKFLNPGTRASKLKIRYLLKIREK
jgi:4-amino-4-deoxy-L-arabinose transferase-like glycosyltransferase